MNAKKVKLLRQSLGYHPSDPRKYEVTDSGTLILVKCSRHRYRNLKKYGSGE
jgi:hypothetical protein